MKYNKRDLYNTKKAELKERLNGEPFESVTTHFISIELINPEEIRDELYQAEIFKVLGRIYISLKG